MITNLPPKKAEALIEKILQPTPQQLSQDEWSYLLQAAEEDKDFAVDIRQKASALRDKHFGRAVYLRGLIEVSNICAKDCFYCGIRRSNNRVKRYRLSPEQILACCSQGEKLKLHTFVLQSGEDGTLTDSYLIDLIKKIKAGHPQCAVTLSLGERSTQSYQKLYEAGADRYLLRHETASAELFAKLKPTESSLANRMRCLQDLKTIGYQVGCGFMVGAPYQTRQDLAADFCFIQQFKPHMVGIGPFIPHRDTPFANFSAGSLETTLNCLALLRLSLPKVLLPATTALATLSPEGRILGMNCGCNVVMPNLSPLQHRSDYTLYDNKAFLNTESAEGISKLAQEFERFGYFIDYSRGDALPQ